MSIYIHIFLFRSLTIIGYYKIVNIVPCVMSLLLFSFIYSSVYMRRRQWQPTPVLLPGKSRGQRSLVGCNPWGREESDMTERFHFHFSVSYIGEGNGNPLQRSCWRIPGTGKPGGLPSMGSHRVRHN